MVADPFCCISKKVQCKKKEQMKAPSKHWSEEKSRCYYKLFMRLLKKYFPVFKG